MISSTAGNKIPHNMGILGSGWVSFTWCSPQSRLQNLTGKGREGGSWKWERSNFQVAQVIASEPYNHESISPDYWSENQNCWLWQTKILLQQLRVKLTVPVLAAGHSAAFNFRTSSSLDRGRNQSSYPKWSLSFASTCLILDLALSKPSANTQHSMAEATHGSHQVGMATNVLSHTGEKRGKVKNRVGRRQLHEPFNIHTRRKRTDISMDINLRKAVFSTKVSLVPRHYSFLASPRPCQNHLKSYYDLWSKEQAPKYLWMLPKEAHSDSLK